MFVIGLAAIGAMLARRRGRPRGPCATSSSRQRSD
jgi:hypothetical protein